MRKLLTFAALAAFGFSLNTLTLFGLVLAVGIGKAQARACEELDAELLKVRFHP